MFGQEFSAEAQQSYHAGPLLPCWDGVTDMEIWVFAINELGDVPANGETIIFDFEYRIVAGLPGAPGGSGLDDDTVVLQLTYTQSGAGTDCLGFVASISLDKDDTEQPYNYGDSVMGTLSWNAASTYSGSPIVGNVLFFIPLKHDCRAG